MDNRFFYVLIIVAVVVAAISFLPLGIAANTVGPNYKNVTVRTQANITNSLPEVINVTVHDASNTSLRNITIVAGGFKDIICNVTLRDWNGFNDIVYVNATIWHNVTSTFGSADNNVSHYTNGNCTNSGNGDNYTVNYLCNFSVLYYSNNGTWICNASVLDNQSASNYGAGSTVFYPVYALNVTDGIDYGSIAVDDYSQNVTANISNLGNMPINVTVEGYGTRKGDGLAMNCSLGGNITIGNQRFSTTDVDWDYKIPMNGSLQYLPNLTLLKQTDSNIVTNSTYWQIFISSTNKPGGTCGGYVIFTAVAP